MSDTIRPLKLKNKNFCDGCEHLKNLQTISQMHECKIYKIKMLAQYDAYIANKGFGYYPRPEKCQEEDQCPPKKEEKEEGHIEHKNMCATEVIPKKDNG